MSVTPLRPTSWLAKRLGLSVSTVERLRARRGDALPPHITIGGHSIRYDEDAVEAWITQRQGCSVASRPQPNVPDGFRRIDKKLIRRT